MRKVSKENFQSLRNVFFLFRNFYFDAVLRLFNILRILLPLIVQIQSLDIKRKVCNRKKIIKNNVVVYIFQNFTSKHIFFFCSNSIKLQLLPRYRNTCSENNNLAYIPSLCLTKRSIRVSRSGNFSEEERYRRKRRSNGRRKREGGV